MSGSDLKQKVSSSLSITFPVDVNCVYYIEK